MDVRAKRRGAKSQAKFLLELGGLLASLSDPWKIQAAAARALGEELKADRAEYADILDERESIIYCDWCNGVPSIAGRYPVSDFGQEVVSRAKRGEPNVIHDVTLDPTIPESVKGAYRAIGVAAMIGISLVRKGQWVAAFGVSSATPRRWTRAEVELVKTTADRTWAAVQEARAEAFLRESQGHLGLLIENTPLALAMFDRDMRYLKVSRQWITQFRLDGQDIIGRSHYDVFPDLNERWKEAHRRGLTGEEVACESDAFEHSDGTVYHNRWKIVPWYNPSGEIGGIVLYIEDITDRKRAEDEEAQRLADLSILYSCAAELANRKGLDDLVDYAVSALQRDFGLVFAWLGRIESNGAVVQVALARSAAAGSVHHLPRYVEEDCLLSKAIEDRDVIVVSDNHAKPRLAAEQSFADPEAKSYAYVPIQYAGEVRKVFVLGGPKPGHFNAERVRLIRACALQVGLALWKARLLQDAQQEVSRIESLRKVDQAITGSLDLGVTMNVLLNELQKQVGVSAAVVRLLDPQSNTLVVQATSGLAIGHAPRSELRLGEGHAGMAATDVSVVSINDLRAEPEEYDGTIGAAPPGGVKMKAIPLVCKGRVRGTLDVLLFGGAKWESTNNPFLYTLAGQAAIAIDSASMFGELETANRELLMAYETTLEGWSKALEMRDKETDGHTTRVTELATQLAEALGLASSDLVHIRRGALLHDIGKLGVPDAILLKPGPLSDEEWAIMKMHTVLAFEWLSPIAYLQPAVDIPYCHHEKWDGSGYPRGLKGKDIPLAARIFAPIDVWDALVNDRPYRAAMPRNEALEVLRRGAGSHFDPYVVKVFLDILS